MLDSAEQQRIVQDVFAATGRTLPVDDPIVLAALFQASLVRSAGDDAAAAVAKAAQAQIAELTRAAEMNRAAARLRGRGDDSVEQARRRGNACSEISRRRRASGDTWRRQSCGHRFDGRGVRVAPSGGPPGDVHRHTGPAPSMEQQQADKHPIQSSKRCRKASLAVRGGRGYRWRSFRRGGELRRLRLQLVMGPRCVDRTPVPGCSALPRSRPESSTYRRPREASAPKKFSP